MRIIQIRGIKQARQIMQGIGVDPGGIRIMAPKAITHLIRINSLSNIAANILKQEMLSLGADAAIARDALTGKAKKTDCLLMGNLSQFSRLNERLNKQPFGLSKLAGDLSSIIANYQRDRFSLDLGKYKLNLGLRTYIMGIINLTPDSFSGDGLYQGTRQAAQGTSIIDFVQKMVKDGADIIDVGGESTRPGARPISVQEELKRTIPAIKILAKKIKVPISIDTYKPEVAKQALDNGAAMVNDITGLRNSEMIKVVAKYKAAVVITHMQGNPQTMQNNPKYVSLTDEIIEYLEKSISRAVEQGINNEKILIDPGIGFGKALGHNLEILKSLREFKILGRPVLIGPSRKSFIGKILKVEPEDRLSGTVSSCLLAVSNGADMVRVHDVKEVKQALRIADAILNC